MPDPYYRSEHWRRLRAARLKLDRNISSRSRQLSDRMGEQASATVVKISGSR